MSDQPLLEVDGLTKEFTVNAGVIPRLLGNQRALKAVRDVSFSVRDGETVALVGESGAGKSTVGNLIARIHRPTRGTIRFRGTDVHAMTGSELQAYRRSVQMVFQDPYSSLDPRFTIGRSIAEPLEIHTDLDQSERRERVGELLETVDLDPSFRNRYPHELSGGQLQRVAIAVALSVEPDFVVLDEPVSALDVSVQARILNLLMRLQQEYELSYLVISHDLSVVRHISHRVAVMYLGEVVERGPTDALFAEPKHPYTEGLLASLPVPDPHEQHRRLRLRGEIPSPLDPPMGCSFHPRCEYATERCEHDDPSLEEAVEDRWVACHHWEQVGSSEQPVSEGADQTEGQQADD